jgi:hypothetical protein
MSKIKGSTIISRLKYAEVRGASQTKDAVIQKLSPDFQDKIKIGILMAAWYPFEYYSQLHRAIDQVMGKGDLAVLLDVGKYSAELAVHGVTKIFFKLGSPEFILKRASAVWHQHYTSGLMEPIFGEKKTVTLLVKEFEEDSNELLVTVAGWIKRVMELSGGRNVTIDYKKFPEAAGIAYQYNIKWL